MNPSRVLYLAWTSALWLIVGKLWWDILSRRSKINRLGQTCNNFDSYFLLGMNSQEIAGRSRATSVLAVVLMHLLTCVIYLTQSENNRTLCQLVWKMPDDYEHWDMMDQLYRS